MNKAGIAIAACLGLGLLNGPVDNAAGAQIEEAHVGHRFQTGGTLHEMVRPAQVSATPAPRRHEAVRRRLLEVDLQTLEGLQGGGGETLRFGLFDDATYDVVINQRKPLSTASVSFRGFMPDEPMGKFLAVVRKGVLAATLFIPG